jgi:hypothetical protein
MADQEMPQSGGRLALSTISPSLGEESAEPERPARIDRELQLGCTGMNVGGHPGPSLWLTLGRVKT